MTWLYSSRETIDYEYNYCRKYFYEKEIRETTDRFSIEDYEVFQIITIYNIFIILKQKIML
jgi:hypothetical protein